MYNFVLELSICLKDQSFHWTLNTIVQFSVLSEFWTRSVFYLLMFLFIFQAISFSNVLCGGLHKLSLLWIHWAGVTFIHLQMVMQPERTLKQSWLNSTSDNIMLIPQSVYSYHQELQNGQNLNGELDIDGAVEVNSRGSLTFYTQM